MQKEYSQNTLLDIFVILRKYLFGMFVIFVTIVSVVIILTLRQVPIYEVVSSIMVNYGREYVYHPVRKSGEIQPQYNFRLTEWINTEIEIFRSKELAEKVLESIGIEQFFPKLAGKVEDKQTLMAMATHRFGKKLQLFHVPESSVIKMTIEHPDPEIALQAANLLIELFKEHHLQIFKNPQTEFLEKQIGSYMRKVEESENALKTYKQENKIFSLDHQQPILMEQYVRINSMLIEVRSNLLKAEELAANLENQLKTVPETVEIYEESAVSTDDDSLASTRASLLRLQLEENKLMEKYPEGHRLLVAVRKDIDLVEKFLTSVDKRTQDRVRTGVNNTFQQLSMKLTLAKADYAAQKEKTAEVERQLNRIEEELQMLSEQEIEFRKLSTQVEATAKAYKNFAHRLEDSRIRDAMDRQKMINVVVIEKPMVLNRPIKPRKKINLMVGLILGTACAVSYGLLKENVMGRTS